MAATTKKHPRHVELPVTQCTEESRTILMYVAEEVRRDCSSFDLTVQKDGTIILEGPLEFVLWAFYLFIELRIRDADLRYNTSEARNEALDNDELWTGFLGVKEFLEKKVSPGK